MHAPWTTSCNDAVEDEPLHWGCCAGSDHGLELFTKVHRAGQIPDCMMALRSVEMSDGNALSPEVSERRFSTLRKQEWFDGVESPVNGEEETGKEAGEA